MEDISHIKRRELLTALIEEWNANRLDLFEISLPDEVSLIQSRSVEILFTLKLTY